MSVDDDFSQPENSLSVVTQDKLTLVGSMPQRLIQFSGDPMIQVCDRFIALAKRLGVKPWSVRGSAEDIQEKSLPPSLNPSRAGILVVGTVDDLASYELTDVLEAIVTRLERVEQMMAPAACQCPKCGKYH